MNQTKFLNELLWLGIKAFDRDDGISNEAAIQLIEQSIKTEKVDWHAGCPLDMGTSMREKLELRNPSVLTWVFTRMIRDARKAIPSTDLWIKKMNDWGLGKGDFEKFVNQNDLYKVCNGNEAYAWLGFLRGDEAAGGEGSKEPKLLRDEGLKKVIDTFGIIRDQKDATEWLDWCVFINDVDLAEWIIKKGGDVNAEMDTRFGRRDFHGHTKALVSFVKSVEMFDLFVSNGWKDEPDKSGKDPLGTFRTYASQIGVPQKDAIINLWTAERVARLAKGGNENNGVDEVWNMLNSAKTQREVSAILKNFDIKQKDEKGRNVLVMALEENPPIAGYVLSAKKQMQDLVLEDYNGVSTRMRLLTSTNESKKLFDAAIHGLTKEDVFKEWKEVLKDRLVMRWRRGASSSWESFFGNHKNTERMEEFFAEKSARTIQDMVGKKEISVEEMLRIWIEEDNFMLGREQRKIPWGDVAWGKMSDVGMLFISGLRGVMNYKEEEALNCFISAIEIGGGDLIQKAMEWATEHVKKDTGSVFYIKEFEKVQREVEHAILNSGVSASTIPTKRKNTL